MKFFALLVALCLLLCRAHYTVASPHLPGHHIVRSTVHHAKLGAHLIAHRAKHGLHHAKHVLRHG